MQNNQNIAAMNAQRNLMHTQGQLSSSLEKLSSGFRINRAADDAAGLVNSENLRAQIGGLGEAQRNAQDGISMIQTAEGALDEMHASLQRIRDLVVDSQNGTNDDEAIDANQAEVDALIEEIERIATDTQFGTQTLFDGTFDGEDALTLQVGANDGQTIDVELANLTEGDVELDSDGDFNVDGDGAIAAVDAAITAVSDQRGALGAVQNRLEATVRNLGVAQENLQAAESRIRDTDMASEMVEFTRHQILQQAGTAMLAQANMVPQSVLGLLQ